MNTDKHILDQKRQTGRTTRMLRKAVELFQEGKDVHIITATYVQGRQFKEMLKYLMTEDREIMCGLPMQGFDWETLTYKGRSCDNLVILIDHYAIESRFSAMLEMMTMFDENNIDD